MKNLLIIFFGQKMFPRRPTATPLVGQQNHARKACGTPKKASFSMDWSKVKSTENPHIAWENLWFPVSMFPLNPIH